ncbi:NAD(P)/FAD-dependent oxidoreductase, partial [Alphaproteobacteria bacterium]|nr:NAD(P)/FAD-dependent oxidoreductase [Alphaproteobacteria bacterium]
ASPAQFLSGNQHFCKSALQQYTQHDFIALMEKHGIAYHEKKLGQLFCDNSAQDVIDMLIVECAVVGAKIASEVSVSLVREGTAGFVLETTIGQITSASLVIATGGLSIPKIGATGFGYDIAEQFGLKLVPRRAGLVPLTFDRDLLARCKALSGLSVEAEVRLGKIMFAEGLLFTHRGLSGPSILQISSYWQMGQAISVNLAPNFDMNEALLARKRKAPKQDAVTVLSEQLPRRLAMDIVQSNGGGGRLADTSDKDLQRLGKAVNDWQITPAGTEGYRTAEVTLGGVDTAGLSSKTMQALRVPNLYFIGEVVDVTGYLGGYNFQWAWSSGYVAGLNV